MLAKLLQNFTLPRISALRDNPAWMLLVSDPRLAQRLLFGYLALLVGYLLTVKLAMPIVMTDTDMWYHLNGGRYFWTTGQVPSTTFFSFIEPPREWVNYFWGFQALVSKIYDFFGYQGLVIFRALLFSLTISVVLAFIFFKQKVRQQPALFLVLATVMVIIIEARSTGVRPHLISYLFIGLFIHILQNRPRLAPLLPVLAVIWINMHGVEWVVGALVCGAYLIEHIYSGRSQGGSWRKLLDRYVVSILGCSLALVINPFGMQVITSSFAQDQDIYSFITELAQINTAVLYSFTFSLAGLSLAPAVTIFSALEFLGAFLLVMRRRMRVSHMIMAIGGAYLFSKGVRFIWEWVLLSLPLVHGALSEYVFSIKRPRHLIFTKWLVVGYFAVIPFVTLAPKFIKYAHYPFDPKGLPSATVSFLRQNNAAGNIYAPPSVSGYLEWALYPDMLIYADMEFPPFEGFDAYTAIWGMSDKRALGRLLERYALDFIAVGVGNKGFPNVIAKYPQFVPVFFDDSYVLYANRNTQARLVNLYEIEDLNPFKLLEDELTDEQRFEALKRVAKLNPDGRRVNLTLTWTIFNLKRYHEALEYAERFKTLYPLDPNSHYWVGNILENLDRCDEAVPHFKEALRLSDQSFAVKVKKHLGNCAYFLKDFDEAYDWFSQSMNPYRNQEYPSNMYQYAYSTAIVGDVEKAIRLLDMLLWTLDPEEESLKAKAEKFRKDLISNDMSDLGIVSWLRSLID